MNHLSDGDTGDHRRLHIDPLAQRPAFRQAKRHFNDVSLLSDLPAPRGKHALLPARAVSPFQLNHDRRARPNWNCTNKVFWKVNETVFDANKDSGKPHPGKGFCAALHRASSRVLGVYRLRCLDRGTFYSVETQWRVCTAASFTRFMDSQKHGEIKHTRGELLHRSLKEQGLLGYEKPMISQRYDNLSAVRAAFADPMATAEFFTVCGVREEDEPAFHELVRRYEEQLSDLK